MIIKHLSIDYSPVLPLTREWIEIEWNLDILGKELAFSLLRGSGLKSRGCCLTLSVKSSPSYEGVD